MPVSAAWPLVLSAIIYLVMIGGEVYYSRTPAQVAPLVVNAVDWNGPQSWQYELRNVEDTLVGEGECQLNTEGTALQLSCSSFVMAYEVIIGQSTWMSVGGSRADQVRWQSNDGRLLSGQSNLNLREGEFRLDVSWTAAEDGLKFQKIETDLPDSSFFVPYSETPLQENNLLMVPDYTWPWQLGGIDLETGAVGEVARFNPYIWRDATQDMGLLWESRPVTVSGVEQVTTPAGSFMAWKVQFGDNQAAWYNLDHGLTVVKFFNGAETWSLK